METENTGMHEEKAGHGHNGRHKPHSLPYYDPDYDQPHQILHVPPENPRFPDLRIFGQYATRNPPAFILHPAEQMSFRPRKADFKAPFRCDGQDEELCVRKDHRAMTVDEQNRFVNAFMLIKFMHALGPLVDIHANALHQMHSNPRFLPWHRVYLLRMEELLMSADPTVCIPYWRSSEEQAIPSWLAGLTPTVELMSGPHTVTRNPGLFARLPDAADVAAAMAQPTFNGFSAALEGIHNSGHVWVGGSMASVMFAPCDPLFWMHHCELDRIWAEWQISHPGQDPALVDASAIMDPWEELEPDIRDITALGYRYA